MGRREGNPYNLPLALTIEMKKAVDKLKVKFDDANDFPIGLKVFRAGLIFYNVLTEDDMRAMYIRGKVTDDEVLFLVEAKLCKDFRPVRVEALLEADELKELNVFFGKVVEQWDGLKESSKMGHLENAKKYPTLGNAVKLVNLVKAEARKLEVSK